MRRRATCCVARLRPACVQLASPRRPLRADVRIHVRTRCATKNGQQQPTTNQQQQEQQQQTVQKPKEITTFVRLRQQWVIFVAHLSQNSRSTHTTLSEREFFYTSIVSRVHVVRCCVDRFCAVTLQLKPLFQRRAVYDWAGDAATDLPLKKGDILDVLDDTLPTGWWLAVNLTQQRFARTALVGLCVRVRASACASACACVRLTCFV